MSVNGPHPGQQVPAKPSPGWKQLLALLSLVLTGLLWFNGLLESLQRPSVGNALALRQLELQVLAEPAIPPAGRALLGGQAPLKQLRDELRHQIDQAQTPPPPSQALELALLNAQAGQAEQARQELNALQAQVTPEQRPLLEALGATHHPDGGNAGNLPSEPSRQSSEASRALGNSDQLTASWTLSPLQQQLVCQRLSAGPAQATLAGACASTLDPGALAQRQHQALLRLLGVSVAPVVLLLLGSALLLRQLWKRWRRQLPAAPALVGPPQNLVDVTLLVAGGFVVCGELLTPLLLAPWLQSGLGVFSRHPALQQALTVLGMYGGLMSLPLVILWAQLRHQGSPPQGGWLQWRWRPLATAARAGLLHVLMVLPLVTLVGWLMEHVVGGGSGSNPLLELVLNTANPLALALFALTAIVLAPLFEETLFRGVLLPVIGVRYGGFWAVVVSALVFGIAHLSLGELPALVVLGLGLGWLRLQSGRLAPSVVMHGLWNGLTFVNLLLFAG